MERIEIDFCAEHGWVKSADGYGASGHCPYGDHRCERIEVLPASVARDLADALEPMLQDAHMKFPWSSASAARRDAARAALKRYRSESDA